MDYGLVYECTSHQVMCDYIDVNIGILMQTMIQLLQAQQSPPSVEISREAAPLLGRRTPFQLVSPLKHKVLRRV